MFRTLGAIPQRDVLTLLVESCGVSKAELMQIQNVKEEGHRLLMYCLGLKESFKLPSREKAEMAAFTRLQSVSRGDLLADHKLDS